MLWFWLWYCFDDWVAEVTGHPALGEIPWPVVLLISLLWLGIRYPAIRDRWKS